MIWYQIWNLKKSKSYSHWIVLRGRNLNISLVFISQSYFKVPKTIRINAINYFVIKIPDKKEIQQIASNHSTDIDLKISLNLIKNLFENHTHF